MDEFPLRLPAETKESLQAEATERGVSLGEHIRDIIDAYRSKDTTRRCPAYELEYSHSVTQEQNDASEDSSDRNGEEIGSFSYGSKSIFS